MINSLFKKKQKLSVPESLILKKLKSIAEQNNLFIYENISFYHNEKSYLLPLLLLDTKRGIYLFEYKNWSYDELKLSKIKKATNTTQAENTLTFEAIHNIILEKISFFSNNKKLPIFNFLLMENLNSEQYEHLDDSFKELLPYKKILFNDTTDVNILSKLQAVSKKKKNIFKVSHIVSNIAFQYSILDDFQTVQLVTKEQEEFIQTSFGSHVTLSGKIESGKSSALLTKAIFEHVKNKNLKIILLKKTTLACELTKRKLLFIAKDKTLGINEKSIEIITPLDLINIHLRKLNLPTLEHITEFNSKLFTTKINAADMIFCDDADFLEEDVIKYIMHIQENKPLLFVTMHQLEKHFFFTKSFKVFKEEKKFHHVEDSYEKVVILLKELLKNAKKHEILIVSDHLSRSFLQIDILESFKIHALMLDPTKTLEEQSSSPVILSTYFDFYALKPKYIMLLDSCNAPSIELAHLFYLADKSTHIIYEEECDKIISLQKNLHKG